MAKKKTLKAEDLKGLFIYHDPKYGTIFYDIFTKKGYQLIGQDVPSYQVYTGLFPLCFFIGYFAYAWFKVSFAACIITSVIVWIIGEVLARFLFFYKLPFAKNWKPFKRDSIFVSMAKNYTHLRLGVVVLLLVALAFSLMYSAKLEEFTGLSYYISAGLSGGCIVFGAICLISLIVKFVKKL